VFKNYDFLFLFFSSSGSSTGKISLSIFSFFSPEFRRLRGQEGGRCTSPLFFFSICGLDFAAHPSPPPPFFFFPPRPLIFGEIESSGFPLADILRKLRARGFFFFPPFLTFSSDAQNVVQPAPSPPLFPREVAEQHDQPFPFFFFWVPSFFPLSGRDRRVAVFLFFLFFPFGTGAFLFPLFFFPVPGTNQHFPRRTRCFPIVNL